MEEKNGYQTLGGRISKILGGGGFEPKKKEAGLRLSNIKTKKVKKGKNNIIFEIKIKLEKLGRWR